MNDRSKKTATARKEYVEILSKIESLEEKYINNLVNAETYQKWYGKYKTTESALRFEIEQLQGDNGDKWKLFESELPKLGNLKYIWQKSTLLQKKTWLNFWFKSKLWYENGVYRTAYFMKEFALKAALLKEKRLLEIEQPLHFSGKIPLVPQAGLEPALTLLPTGF